MIILLGSVTQFCQLLMGSKSKKISLNTNLEPIYRSSLCSELMECKLKEMPILTSQSNQAYN